MPSLRKAYLKPLLAFVLLLGLLIGCQTAPPPVLESPTAPLENLYVGGIRTTNVMAPLYMTQESQWTDFRNQLTIAKSMGVDAVSVDVWWGIVEAAGDQSFNWAYYDRMVTTLEGAGLKWVPILSFHQCGGNVGDDCNIPIPGWLWNRYSAQGISANDLRYQSEQGNYSLEYISLWADSHVMHQYREFMLAFQNRYNNKAYLIQEINISAGPAGELRYPSYNSHDQMTGYPHRGALQAYGRLARENFRSFALTKYGTLAGVNRAWGTTLTSTAQINPPPDSNSFFGNGQHRNSQYGRDFFDWYNGALVDHGKRKLQTAINTFSSTFAVIELGIKIPGVHWRMGHPTEARTAEMTAGLIPTSVDIFNANSGYGYNRIIGVVSSFNNSGRKVVLHFTCLEMGNQNYAPQYSRAEDLVFWVARAAETLGVSIKGENALAGGVNTHFGWDKMENASRWASYSGLTVLRLNHVTWNQIGRERYTRYIQNFK